MAKLTTQLNELNSLKATFPRGKDGRIQYTNSFRKRVVQLMESKSMDVTQTYILNELNLNSVMFATWRRHFKKHGYEDVKVAVSASRYAKANNSSVVSTLQTKRAELISEVAKIDQAIKLLEELGV